MKVLLYAVFKDQRTQTLSVSRSHHIAIRRRDQTGRIEVHSLKAEQCSSTNAIASDRLGKLLARAAQSTFEDVEPVISTIQP
jgi:hypothetical protein